MDVQDGTSPNNAEQYYTIVFRQLKLREDHHAIEKSPTFLVNRAQGLFMPLAFGSGLSTSPKWALA